MWDELNKKTIELFRSGKYPEALESAKKALSEAEAEFGATDPRVARSLNNLAEIYRSQANYDEAEPLWKRALEIRTKAFGRNHPDVAISLNNLAGAYFEQGKFAEAEKMFRGAIDVMEKSLGSDHPDLAISLVNMAAAYRAMGKIPGAKPLYRPRYSHPGKGVGTRPSRSREHFELPCRVIRIPEKICRCGAPLQENAGNRRKELRRIPSSRGFFAEQLGGSAGWAWKLL